ncbi:DNA-directed RNA polymerase subunit omega [bacterium]|jgi:DNA-directed RNA polymerase subunit omega|nr:DNA-directed RNA polymerase subunit omega [bacterium]
MARITVEDCLEKEQNRFSLVQLASKRTKQILTGAKPLVDVRRGNKAVVNSLREIAAGLVRFKTEEDLAREREEEEKRLQAELALAAEQESIAEENIFITKAVVAETPSIDESSVEESGDSEPMNEDGAGTVGEDSVEAVTESVATEESSEEESSESEKSTQANSIEGSQF